MYSWLAPRNSGGVLLSTAGEKLEHFWSAESQKNDGQKLYWDTLSSRSIWRVTPKNLAFSDAPFSKKQFFFLAKNKTNKITIGYAVPEYQKAKTNHD